MKALTARHEIRSYLRSTTRVRVNVGCGANVLDGWLNTDLYPRPGIVQMDAARPWPLPPGSVHAVHCEHMIEHVPKPMARQILEEAWRSLAPGGVVRVVTPDMAAFARFALGLDNDALSEYKSGFTKFFDLPEEPSTCDIVNQIYYGHGHRYIYLPEELTAMLADVGFEDMQLMRGGEYASQETEGIDGHPKVLGARINAIEAFAIEARKPTR
ncbi:MAG: class I SAM-dependent methyltransferase [Gammaproteobacteria bacterium]